MNILNLAKEHCRVIGIPEDKLSTLTYEFKSEQLELFAQKIIAERDKEWMAEPVAYVEWTLDEASWYLTYSKAEGNQRQEPLFKKPKEVK